MNTNILGDLQICISVPLTLTFMTLHPGEQTISTHILPNILRSNGNQTMKLGQLIENMKKREKHFL